MIPQDYLAELDNTVQWLQQRVPRPPQIGIILGSGLSLPNMRAATVFPYGEIPHFAVSTVPGHLGQLVIGQLGKKTVAVLAGRVHLYEGHAPQKVVFPVRVLGKLGIQTLVVTNAAGGVNKSFQPGDLMLIEDHINLTGANPLVGANLESLGTRFPDMTEAYSKRLLGLTADAGKSLGLRLQRGVYLGLLGPSFETPAEIRLMRTLGADAVGMSTVHEVIAARHMNIEVLGISCITNMAAGLSQGMLHHQEVIETTERIKETFTQLLVKIVAAM